MFILSQIHSFISEGPWCSLKVTVPMQYAKCKSDSYVCTNYVTVLQEPVQVSGFICMYIYNSDVSDNTTYIRHQHPLESYY
jgi:hypothetical protein